jgi:predicted Zn-dependent protease
MRRAFVTAAAVISSALLGACANSQFAELGASVLSSTGYVDESQAKGFLLAGSKAIKSQEELTPEQEYYLGRAVSARILGTYPPKLDSTLTRYVNDIGQVIISVSDLPETFGGYHFAVIESDEVNAVSAPGGFVFISQGLIRRLKDEDSLAAVLAHEVAHVVHRDGVSAISNANLFAALTEASRQAAAVGISKSSVPLDISPLADMFSKSVTDLTEKLLVTGYDRSQEYKADAYAVELLRRAGYETSALARVLSAIESSTPTEHGGWLDTHPAPNKRMAELEEEDNSSSGQAPSAVRTARFARLVR